MPVLVPKSDKLKREYRLKDLIPRLIHTSTDTGSRSTSPNVRCVVRVNGSILPCFPEDYAKNLKMTEKETFAVIRISINEASRSFLNLDFRLVQGGAKRFYLSIIIPTSDIESFSIADTKATDNTTDPEKSEPLQEEHQALAVKNFTQFQFSTKNAHIYYKDNKPFT